MKQETEKSQIVSTVKPKEEQNEPKQRKMMV